MKKILASLLLAASIGTQAQIGPDPGFEEPEYFYTHYLCAQVVPGSSPVVLYSGTGYIYLARERAYCLSIGGSALLHGPY